MGDHKTPIKSGFWLLIEYFARYAISFLVAVAVARYLGPSDYGRLNFVTAFCTVFVVFTSLGLDELIVKRFVRSDSIGDEFYSAFFLRGVGSIISYFMMILIAYLYTGVAILIGIYGTIVFLKSLDIVEIWLRSQLNGKLISVAKMSSLIFISILKVIAIVLNWDLTHFVVIYALEFFVLFLLYLIIFLKEIKPGFVGRIKGSTIISILKEGFPLILSAVIIVLYTKVDVLMLNRLANEYEVGVYSAAAKICLLLNAISLVLCNSIFPKISEKKSWSRAYKQTIFDMNALVVFTVCLPFFLVSSWLIDYALGPEYIASKSILNVYVWGTFFVAMITVKNNFLILERKSNYHFLSNLIGLITIISLNFLLVPKLGGVGAAISTVVSHFVLAIVSTFIFPKTREYAIMGIKSLFWFPRIRVILRTIRSFY